MTTPKDLTAADVAAWLVAQTAALDFPTPLIAVFTSEFQADRVYWMVSSAPGIGTKVASDSCDTLEEAVAKVRANIKSPKDKVEALRAQASELSRQANELEATISQ